MRLGTTTCTHTGKTSTALLIFAGSIFLFAGLVYLLVRTSHSLAGDQKKPLLVYCAAGIRTPAEALARQYAPAGNHFEFTFGGSQTLLANLSVSGKGDLYLPADSSYLLAAQAKGLVRDIVPIARMHIVLAVKAGNPKSIHSLADLLLPHVKIAQANPDAAAIGTLTRTALKRAGLWDEIRIKTLVFKPTVNDVANDIAIGSVDAGFLWNALATQYPELETIRLPEFNGAIAEIAVGTLTSSHDPEAALAFARYLAAPGKGLDLWRQHGYELLLPSH